MHVIGIDAGGSKTVCLLADSEGRIVSEARGPGVNLHAVGEQRVERELQDVIGAVFDKHHLTPDVICLGIAGVDREDDATLVSKIMTRVAAGVRTLVVNDALIALVAGAGDAPGIVVIAGTGSIAYGRSGQFVAARAGGWGHMIGDEGSGFWIGQRALSAVVREADGRGPSTRLTEDVLGYFKVPDAARLVRIVYDLEEPRKSVVLLGPIVQRASERGDAVATHILEQAADELALGARSVATRLGMRGEEFPFVLSGSVFRLVPRLVIEMERRLLEIAPRAAVRLLTAEPATGAVRLALAEASGGASVPRYL
jgi:N-acetylglucosamine kinase-like BadF-type ATPase